MNTARHRFYDPALPAMPDQDIPLEQEQAHHAIRVLRIKADETIELFDGRGNSVLATVKTVHKRQCIVSTRKDTYRTQSPHQPHLTIACAMPKPSRMDDMVNMLTQLGVDALMPLDTQRSVSELRPNRLKKLERQVVEACKQCGRNHLMTIDTPTPLTKALTQSADIRLMLDLQADETPRPTFKTASHILLFVGPEGGWTDTEREQMHEANVQAWTIHPYILRIETAAAAAASLVRYDAMSVLR